jgi:hypothetical protein
MGIFLLLFVLVLLRGVDSALCRCTATAAAAENITVYRITPLNVTGLRNKDSADAAGDLSYLFESYPQKVMPADCSEEPLPPSCWRPSSVAPMIGQFQVEVDGRYGFYEECNPSTTGGTQEFFCLGGSNRSRAQRPRRQACRCSEGDHPVGREPAFGVGGLWYSTPVEGECAEGQPLGSDGCSWRLLRTVRYVSFACMRSRIDKAVARWAPHCFQGCSASDLTCWKACYHTALNGDSRQNITRLPASQVVPVWESAFQSKGTAPGNGAGCPAIQPYPCLGSQCQ